MSKLSLQLGDITKIKVDAIVNAANTSLMGGGGVDGAIHRAGGPAILAECRKIGGCATGEAVITTAGNLPSKFVIHTVGPVWHGGSSSESDLLESAYGNSLSLAVKNNCQNIAFPNISTGVYRFPKDAAAKIAVNTCRAFMELSELPSEVIFMCFDEENYRLYKKLLD
jgi:O-acetyl-ADP-ribose deacetylase (regulator of RNase III)